MTRFVNPYTTEAELCAAFSPVATAAGWEVHPEVQGRDFVCIATAACKTWLVSPRHDRSRVEAGVQLVVEAKIRTSIDVLEQALPPEPHVKNAADFYAVLVPTASPAFRAVAKRCGVNVIEATRFSYSAHKWEPKVALDHLNYQHDRGEQKPLWVPHVVVDVVAGTPSPKSSTPWKMKAVQICIDFDGRDLLANDFKAAGIDTKRWKDLGWLIDTGRKAGRHTVYRLCDASHIPLRPDIDYPEVAAALRAQPPESP